MPVILGHSGSKLSRGPLGGAAHGAVSFSSAVRGAAGGVPSAPVRLAHPCGRRLGSLRCRLRVGSCLRGLDPKLPSGCVRGGWIGGPPGCWRAWCEVQGEGGFVRQMTPLFTFLWGGVGTGREEG